MEELLIGAAIGLVADLIIPKPKRSMSFTERSSDQKT